MSQRGDIINAPDQDEVMRLMDKISFNASDMNGQTVNIDAAYVSEALGEVVENEDLSRFIL